MDCALYIVSTPIGNLDDITLRALNTLKNVDIIAAEDTRNTSLLLDKYSIKTKLISYHKFSETKKTALFIDYLKNAKSIALVSDAGTPLISDPGGILVKAVKKEGFRVIPIPGACAITTLLSSIYREGESFKFIGFIERTRNKIEEVIKKNYSENLVFYESPQRLLDTLETIHQICPEKKVSIGRELTKKFEEIKEGLIPDIINYYKINPLKGEVVVLLHRDEIKEDIGIIDKIEKLKKLGFKDKDISSILSGLYNINKNDIYKKCICL